MADKPQRFKKKKHKRVWLMLTWVHLTVIADPIGINNVLKACSELVCLVICRWGLLCLHPMKDGRNSGAALLLQCKDKYYH